jgi:hypothetical protein
MRRIWSTFLIGDTNRVFLPEVEAIYGFQIACSEEADQKLSLLNLTKETTNR